MEKTRTTGPLAGIRVIEFAAKGPCPMCALLLSDLGAEVIRIDRTVPEDGAARAPARFRFLERGRRSIALDLKAAEAREIVLRLLERSDALIEGFRPGVMERLGLGPDECLARNPRAVYGRVTGWGQRSPLAATAGHDINYLAVTGALAAIGEQNRSPVVPLNLLGDFGGGATYLAIGVLSALHEARRSGRGQVVDVAMTDAVISLMTALYAARARGDWVEERGSNFLDGAAHNYGTYETADGKHLAVGAVERKFCRTLFEKLDLDPALVPDSMDRASWPRLKAALSRTIRTKTRAEWEKIFEGSDACVAPVLTMSEAIAHPHNRTREVFVEVAGEEQPAPAPRFSRTPAGVPSAPAAPGEHSGEILRQLGYEAQDIRRMEAQGTIGGPSSHEP
ncbi:MAG: CoA transferase [Burkholderiales bacterium]|nr:CoA transferase [Burkholderiales bacterium]